MAQKVIKQLIDDLDRESTATETVSFSLDGVEYEIDLTENHADQLRECFASYIEAGRRTGGRKHILKPGNSTTAPKANRGEIRQWAINNGHQVADRGRIPENIIELYRQANPDSVAL